MSDVIDNYDIILNFAKELAQKEIILGYQKIGEIWFSDDVAFIQKYPVYFKTNEHREAKILSFGNGFCPWNEGWEKYLPEDFWNIDTAERTPEGENYFNNGANK